MILRTFYSRIILINEMALDELNGQARLADTTTADNDELVFTEIGRLTKSRSISCWPKKGAKREEELAMA